MLCVLKKLATLSLKVTIAFVVIIFGGLFLLFYSPPIGIYEEEQRIAYFERNQEKLEAVVTEALSSCVHSIKRWHPIFHPIQPCQEATHEAMKRAKVREVQVNRDKTEVVLFTGSISEGMYETRYVGYRWSDENKDQIKSSPYNLGNGWFLYSYLEDF